MANCGTPVSEPLPEGCPLAVRGDRAAELHDSVFSVRMDTLHRDITDIKEVLKNLTAAVTKFAIVEERQGYAAQALERMSELISKLEERVTALEQKPNVWVERVTVAFVTIGLTVAVTKVFM